MIRLASKFSELQPGRYFAAASLLIVFGLFGWLVSDLLIRGLGTISWEFISANPTDAGRAGGILPIIISTGMTMATCMVICVPVGLGSALLLSGVLGSGQHSRFSRACRQSLDVLAGVPSIVFGLFGNAFFCIYLGLGFSVLAGGLTLACMVLPFFIRSSEMALRGAADHHLQGSLALGLSHSTLLRKILLPAALPGLVTGFVLALARALAETAALLFTAGYVMRTPESLLESGRVMSVHIFDLAMNVTGGEAQAYGTATLLLLFLAAINLGIALLTRQRHRLHGT